MRQPRARFLATFLAGATLAFVASAIVGSVGSFAATRYDQLSLFTSVLNLVRRNYVEPVEEHTLISGAVRGMLSDLDPHSSFMDGDAYKEMQIDTRGEFHGLGIEITKTKEGFIEVVSPIEGTPASQAGIRARDQIVSICPTEVPEDWKEDCRTTKNMTLFEAVQLMRGRKGTEITIDIYRDGFDRPKPFLITRDVVKIVSVDGRMLEPNYAYVRIRAFQERTDRDLGRVLDKLHDEADGPFEGLVIDLRDNPGGLLDQAVKVADHWLDEGLIVYTKGRVESQRQEYRAHDNGTDPGYPITVLVNAGTASASEIVAGALQDHHRALVLGTKSFGKGSVQTVYPLEGGAGLRLTTALYYTPSGRSIQEVGISPDIPVTEVLVASSGEGDDAESIRIREQDLEGHFRQEETSPETDAPERVADAAPSGPREDVQLARALAVLKSWTYFDRLREERVTDPVQARVEGAAAAGGATP